MSLIDLDRNATAPLHPAAAEAMKRCEAEASGNPSSAHSLGRKARRVLDDSREKIAHLIDARPEEVIFTSGATEANNLAIFGQAGPSPGSLVASELEHPCVIGPLMELIRRGHQVLWLPVTPSGHVSARDVKKRTSKQTRLVVVMLVNHETGAVQDVKAMVDAAPFHCDAASAVGKMPVSFRDLGVTSLSLSAHKFRGPKGIGALILKQDAKLVPQMFGGHQQRGYRPGTETPALAVGMAVALEHAIAELKENAKKVADIRREFFERLSRDAGPVVVNGGGLSGTLNVSFPGCRADQLLIALDLAGIACSTGSACSSGSLLPSPVLKAMNVAPDVLASAMRFSFDAGFTDLEEAVARIAYCVGNARKCQ